MMTITTVEVLSNDSNRRVTYRGQDHNLVWHTYGPCQFRQGDADPTVPANWNIAGKIEQSLEQREKQAWLDGELLADDAVHVGKPIIRNYGRRQYRQSTRQETWRVAKRIVDSITNGEYTELNWRNEFEKTLTQWDNTFYPKLQNQAARWDELQAEVGE